MDISITRYFVPLHKVRWKLLVLVTVVLLAEYGQSNASVYSISTFERTISSFGKGELISVQGVVKDEQGESLAGVTVRVRGTQKGTITDDTGSFVINANPGDTLDFSIIGYNNKSIVVDKNSTNLIIQLQTKSIMGDEVVVVGYGTQKKINLTGSVATVSTKDIKDRSNTNLLTSLQGQVPGVSIISRPGESPSINFRGRGNLGISAPLFVIDGVIASQSIFSSLDPNNIKSISFLKDAASSSIYGSRAAYGVVLVTTKSGKKGKFNISYNGMVGIKSPTYIPNMLNSGEYATLFNEGRVNQGRSPYYTAEQIEKFRKGTDPDHYPNTDWFDLVLDKQVVTTQHSLSFSGGSDKVQYFTGLGYLFDDQFMPGQTNKRYNLYSKVSSDVTDWLNIHGNITYVKQKNDRSNGATSNYHLMFEPPIMVARQSNGDWGSIAGGKLASHNYINYNPLREINTNDWAKGKSTNTILNYGFDLKPIQGLTISGQGSYTETATKVKSYSALEDEVNNFETGKPIPGTGRTSNQMSMDWGSTTRMLYTATAKYRWSNNIHSFTVLAGTSFEDNKFEGLSASRKNFPSDALKDLSAGSSAGKDITNDGGLYEFKLNSYFGRVNYSYLGRYLFEANIRTDGSSRFYKDSRWGVFPSFSAGWIISRESFMEDINWLNLLKVRGSYGSLGNINNVGNYDYFQTYNNDLAYNFNNEVVPGISESKPANDKLTWEEVTITDVGLDLELFKHRLSLTADYYIKNTNNILLGYNVPVEFGIRNNPSQNIGKVQNKGFEFALMYKNNVGDFHYNIGGNMAFNKNKITDLGESDNMIYGGGDVINYIYKVGEPIGAYYGYVTNGLYSQQEIDKGHYYKFGRVPNAGDIKYVPQRTDVAWGDDITGEDRAIIGCDVPEVTYGVNIDMQYKNFGLSVFGQGVGGADVAFENDALLPFFEGGNARKFHLKRWTTENPNPHAVYPRIYGGSSLDNYNRKFSGYSIFDADYFRIKTITLSYRIPKRILSKYDISSFRLFISLENMFTIRADHKMEDFDPETASGRALAIGAKSISFGINLNL